MESLKLAKLFNNLLSSENYSFKSLNIDLKNYVVKFDSTIYDPLLATKSNYNDDQILKQLYLNVNNFIKNKSKINEYLSTKRNKSSFINNQSEETILHELSDSSKEDVEIKEINENKNHISNEIKTLHAVKEVDLQLKIDFINRIKIKLQDDVMFSLNDTLNDLILLDNIELLRQILNEIVDYLVINHDSNAENSIEKFSQSLIDLNSNSTLISYSIATLFFNDLFTPYLIKSNIYQANSPKIKSFTLTRKLILVCESLLKIFPRQFIDILISTILTSINIDNKTNIEFLLKIIKDNFNETLSHMLLDFLVNKYINETWNDNIYIILLALLEKISTFNNYYFNLIINKMNNDKSKFSKSVYFTKVLLNLIHKYKNYLNKSIGNDGICRESIENTIRLIIDDNQTVLKRSLLNNIQK